MKLWVGVWNEREKKLSVVEVDTFIRNDGLYVQLHKVISGQADIVYGKRHGQFQEYVGCINKARYLGFFFINVVSN